MDCTVEEVYEGVRSRLGDTARVGGEVFTNDLLRQPFIVAWDELVQERTSYQVPAVERTVHIPVPAFTSEVYPELFGLVDIAEIQLLTERPAQGMMSITGASSTSPIQITVDTSNLVPGMAYILSGVQGQTGANGRFFLDIDSPTQARLKGSKSSGTYVSGGFLSIDAGEWKKVSESRSLPQRNPEKRLGNFIFEAGRFQFIGATEDVLLKIEYLSSMAAPLSGYVGIDGSRNFLVSRASAAAAAGKRDQLYRQLAADCAAEASGFLDSLVSTMVRELQRTPLQRRIATTGPTNTPFYPFLRNDQ